MYDVCLRGNRSYLTLTIMLVIANKENKEFLHILAQLSFESYFIINYDATYVYIRIIWKYLLMKINKNII